MHFEKVKFTLLRFRVQVIVRIIWDVRINQGSHYPGSTVSADIKTEIKNKETGCYLKVDFPISVLWSSIFLFEMSQCVILTVNKR